MNTSIITGTVSVAPQPLHEGAGACFEVKQDTGDFHSKHTHLQILVFAPPEHYCRSLLDLPVGTEVMVSGKLIGGMPYAKSGLESIAEGKVRGGQSSIDGFSPISLEMSEILITRHI